MTIFAHAAPGFGAVGLSPGLVLYLTAAGVVLTTLALRSRPARPDPVERADVWPGAQLPVAVRAVLGALGIAGLAAIGVCALVGSELLGQNPAPVTVFS